MPPPPLPLSLQLTAQFETWASQDSVRNFWGVTEDQDYNPNCASKTSVSKQQMYLSTCYPNGNAKEKKGWGWFCAQRRPGHALGWLQHMYQDPANIPDMLMIVDDDTAVDIELANRQMTMVQDSQINSHSPFVGNTCVVGTSMHGGSGTFFNRAAIEGMTRPIFCDYRQQENMNFVCNKLQALSFGSHLFNQGDSVFDIFYKYSATRHFCQASDWVNAHMINTYSENGLSQFGTCSRGGRHGGPCDSESIACHFQTTFEHMAAFHSAHQK